SGTFTLATKPRFFSALNQVVSVLSNMVQDLTVSVDPTQDLYVPYAAELNPYNTAIVTNPLQAFTVRLKDGNFGTGVNPAGPFTVTIHGTAAAGVSYSAATQTLSFSAAVPLTVGAHTIVISFADQAS